MIVVAGELLDPLHSSLDSEDREPGLARLYEKAKKNQWNTTTDVDWHIEVDPEQVAVETSIANAGIFSGEMDLSGTPLAKSSDADWLRFQAGSARRR